jgi:uncharacterized protein
MNNTQRNKLHSTILQGVLLLLFFFYSCKNHNQVPNNDTHRHTNALIHESSPYLLQHAHNPVDWQPWGEAALSKAQRENKLLIISIGYAACHWCHVMEHESFEDSTVAALMNEHFVAIKVDREERPDVDDVYMSAAQLITGSGGWPLNAFALPDGRPIWAGTYFPKDRWMDILNRFAELKNTDYPKLESSAQQLTEGIGNLDAVALVQTYDDYPSTLISSISERFLQQMDLVEGGRKGAPKFPMPNNWEYLLKYADVSGDPKVLDAVLTTLNKMAMGGIYDQVGGGFARYSTDGIWKAPHFEKMLYDNAQLMSLYAQAFQRTKDPMYQRVIEESMAFIRRELSAPDGGFYSSLDADSEGEEGKYYVWKAEEIDALVSDTRKAALYKEYYNVSPSGNWENGTNILHITQDATKLEDAYAMSEGELSKTIQEINKILLSARSERIRPALDDKILTSWNALMIKGHVDAYRALRDPEYLDEAIMNAHFILKNQMSDDGRLNRNYKNGKSTINAFLDDYANLIQALTALYEVTFDESWLNVAKDLTEYVIAHFYNPENGMFYYTSDIDAPLVARKMELGDNVIPGSNSMMARNLARLGEIYDDKDWMQKSDQMLSNMMSTIGSIQQPSFYSNWLQLLFDKVHAPYEVVVIGPEAIDVSHELMSHYSRNSFFMGGIVESSLPLLLYKYVEDETMIYVCQNKVCKFPVQEIDQAIRLMK